MSSEMWAMGMLRKYSMAVDFCLNYVEDDWSNKYHWGHREDHASFEDALQYAIQKVEARQE